MAQNPPNISYQLAQLATQFIILQGEVTTLGQENVTITTPNNNLTGQVTVLMRRGGHSSPNEAVSSHSQCNHHFQL